MKRLLLWRRKKIKTLLSLHSKECYKEILFTDEKIVTVEETFNKQNNRIYAWSSSAFLTTIDRMRLTRGMWI